MAYPVKQAININFQQGLNLKADPYQVPAGQFLSLTNAVFDTVGRLTKRNGFSDLTTVPSTATSYLTTYNGDLQALGTDLFAYSAGQNKWVSKNSTYPVELSVMPLVQNSVEQTQADVAIASNGLVMTVYTETNGSSVSYKYVVADSVTGQNILGPLPIPSAATTYGTPRVFLLGNYFLILYTEGSSPYSLNYLAVPVNSLTATASGVVASSYTPSPTLAFDAYIFNSSLYIAYNGASASGIKLLSLSPHLVLSAVFNPDPAHQATLMSVTADEANLLLWVTYYSSSTMNGYALSVNQNFTTILAPTAIITSTTVLNLTAIAQSNNLQFYYEVANNYGYDSSIPTHYVSSNTCTRSGSVGSPFVSARSIGLASKAFLIDSISYYLAVYQSSFQPTYFLMDGTASVETAPIIVGKLAYSNGGSYLTTGLPNVITNGTVATTPYLRKDLLESQAPSGSSSINLKASPVYTQTGVNLANWNFTTDGIATAETANNLHITGGFLWSYDGVLPVEHSFLLWPDSVEATWSSSGGSIVAQPDGITNTNAYFYQVTYEWTDNQGNLFRSAPSIPVAVTTIGSGTTGSVTLNVPTLRLTYKVASPVRIVIYRWSVANQTYYQVTSIPTPIQNNLSVDSISYTDTLADSSIVGNNIIYTTGGIVENINAPSSSVLTLFDDRLWLLDAEDPNLLRFSKTVVEDAPADMSDLLTVFIPPTVGAQGSTGSITALFPMDDKLIIFKENAIYYINGTGPNDTGSNNLYSQPIFITSTVGCTMPRSIAVMPQGLMFKSNKGIWLLGRDLSTTYIGAPVEGYNQFDVTSAEVIPSTNQVRFALSSGDTLMYDYFVQQWGNFQGIGSIASTLYKGLHTIVNKFGTLSQESEGTYLDGSEPVLMSFTTSWLQLAGLRGYQRAYWFYFLGTWISPHFLNIQVAYDYNSSPSQSTLYTPEQSFSLYGSDEFYGGDGSKGYGGMGSFGNVEQGRIFLTRERCRSFQVTIQEVFNYQAGSVAGAGFTMSGLNCMVGLKKSYAPIPQQQQFG